MTPDQLKIPRVSHVSENVVTPYIFLVNGGRAELRLYRVTPPFVYLKTQSLYTQT